MILVIVSIRFKSYSLFRIDDYIFLVSDSGLAYRSIFGNKQATFKDVLTKWKICSNSVLIESENYLSKDLF